MYIALTIFTLLGALAIVVGAMSRSIIVTLGVYFFAMIIAIVIFPEILNVSFLIAEAVANGSG